MFQAITLKNKGKLSFTYQKLSEQWLQAFFFHCGNLHIDYGQTSKKINGLEVL